MKIKPRLKFVTPYFFGIEWKSHWVCKSKEVIEFGNSPLEAYGKWVEKMPKTAIGRWWARFWNRFFDWLLLC